MTIKLKHKTLPDKTTPETLKQTKQLHLTRVIKGWRTQGYKRFTPRG